MSSGTTQPEDDAEAVEGNGINAQVATTAGGVANAMVAPGQRGRDPGVGHLSPQVRVIEQASPWLHVFVWLIGVLLASLAPLLLPYFHGIDQDNTPSMRSLLDHGSLLLIALVITIAGITELILAIRNIARRQLMPVATAILGGLLAIVTEAFWYADLAVQDPTGNKLAVPHVELVVMNGSLGLFAVSALSSAACVYYAAASR